MPSSRSWWRGAGAPPPGRSTIPGRPTIRVGYAEVRVTPERKRLAVAITPDQAEYRPGQRASIGVAVRDAAGGPRASGAR